MLSSFKTSATDIEAIIKKNLSENTKELKDDLEGLVQKKLDIESSRMETNTNYRIEALEVKFNYRLDEIEKKLLHEIEKQAWSLTIRMTGVLTAGLVLLETLHKMFPSLK